MASSMKKSIGIALIIAGILCFDGVVGLNAPTAFTILVISAQVVISGVTIVTYGS